MAEVYYICGQVGSGVPLVDPYRPEIADELPAGVRFLCTQEFDSMLPPTPSPRFIVNVRDLDGSVFADLGYDKTSNPNGFDWFAVSDNGTVTYGAK